jgi:hypothetical protein
MPTLDDPRIDCRNVDLPELRKARLIVAEDHLKTTAFISNGFQVFDYDAGDHHHSLLIRTAQQNERRCLKDISMITFMTLVVTRPSFRRTSRLIRLAIRSLIGHFRCKNIASIKELPGLVLSRTKDSSYKHSVYGYALCKAGYDGLISGIQIISPHLQFHPSFSRVLLRPVRG